MRKSYRVFISSTSDLRAERDTAIRAVQACGCTPCFMEIWPSLDATLTHYIEKQIDLCEFFLLLLGPKYGSLAKAESSFVKLEFDHATKKKLGIIVLVSERKTPWHLGGTSLETPEDAQAAFIRDVQTEHTARNWSDSTELTRLIMSSLFEAIVARESAEVVESNADLVAAVADFVDEQKRQGRKISRAILIQYSAANAKDILKKLIWAGVDTHLFIAEPEVAEDVNSWQKDQVNQLTKQHLQNFLEPLEPKSEIGRLWVYRYRVRGSLRGLLLEVAQEPPGEALLPTLGEADLTSQGQAAVKPYQMTAEFVAIGAYAYMRRWPEGQEREDIRGGELPMTVFRRDHPGCAQFGSMLLSVVGNWRDSHSATREKIDLGREIERTWQGRAGAAGAGF